MTREADEILRRAAERRKARDRAGLGPPSRPGPRRRWVHHGRRGGRALELMILLALLAGSIGLAAAGFWLGVRLLGLGDGPVRRGVFAPFGLAFLGMLASAPLWRAFLRHYRYTNDLRPIEGKEDDGESD